VARPVSYNRHVSRASLIEPTAREDTGRHPFLRGWDRALIGAAATALGAAALAELAMLLLRAVQPLPGTSVTDAARQGWALFYLFHHVGIEVISPNFHLPRGAELVAGTPSGYDIDATVSFAAMTGTLLVLWQLFRAGGATAQAAGGEPLGRGFQGMKIALPYALLSYVPSWWLEFRLILPGASPLTIHPSHLASFFWPAAMAAVMGFAGGLATAGDELWMSDWWETDRWNRRWRGALAGGWSMTWSAMALGVAALLGLAVARPEDTAAFFGAISSHGGLSGLALAVLTALVLPNMAVWLLVPAMGGCLEVGGINHPFCFLSYGYYPGHQLGGLPTNLSGFPNLGPAPGVFLLFLLVPLLAVLFGGMTAARRAEARSPGEAVVAGTAAGVVFAVLFMVLVVVASVRAVFNGPFSYVATGFFRYGPNPVSALQLALLWGAGGGGVGGWLGRPRTRAS
jgi:hypothetical protein